VSSIVCHEIDQAARNVLKQRNDKIVSVSRDNMKHGWE
jgi:hypothetical protein